MSQQETKELLVQPTEQEQSSDETEETEDTNQTKSKIKNMNGHPLIAGQLPDDFLRLDNHSSNSIEQSGRTTRQKSQVEIDEELAASLQHQYDSMDKFHQWCASYQAYISITFVEAHLVKNYGLMNMNPYIRIRIGNTLYETKTCKRGGKNPKWNETCRFYLPVGVEHIAIEIYDNCMIVQDELIAWSTLTIPDRFLRFTGESPEHTFEEKIPLSGQQGEGLEGELSVAINTKPVTADTMRTFITTPVCLPQPTMFAPFPPILARPLVVHQSPVPATALLPPVDNTPSRPPPPLPVELREEDVQKLIEMFPKIEIDLIKSILINERGNLERAITNLLELNSTT